MRWDEVLTVVIAALDANAPLNAALAGSKIEPSESTIPRTVPGLRYTVIYDQEDEVMNPIGVQFDYWAIDREQAVVIERAVRSTLSRKHRRVLGGIEMATQYMDSRDMDDPQQGVVHRSLDFRFEPVRKRTP